MSNKAEKTIMSTEIDSKKTHSFPWNKIIAGCAIIAIFALFLGGYFTYCYFSKSYTTLAHAIDHLQMAQKQNTAEDVQKNLDLAVQSIQELKTDFKQLQQTVANVTQTQQGNKDALDIAEAHYYVKLANVELQYADNIPLAITLLKLADDTIHRLSNTQLDDVRQALANDIANLQSVPLIDVTGLYMRLAALNNQIDRLPLPNKIPNTDMQAVNTTVEQNEAWWKRGLQTTWQALQKMVVVRYNQNGVLPLVTPDQQVFLYQNCHAMLEQSIWALLHHQPIIYQTSLQQITAWVKQYFMQDSSVTQAVITELNQLQAMDIHPKSEGVTGSLQAFDNVDQAR
jgi:uroporphyrin-III C-methyltransferase